MPKPFSIQAPEEIAKQYAGNKQRIAEAARMGVVDPTAAILAGMFIDRMRGAQLEEAMQPATVAQEVMGGAPPAVPSPPAGGLGLTSQAAPPMTPPMPAGLGTPMTAPMEAPMEAPMGMAMGGMTYAPPYMHGGLDAVSVPSGMFDESTDGGYAGGGLVAFATGTDENGVPAPKGTDYFGFNTNPFLNRELIEKILGKRETKYADEEREALLAERSPEARKKARDMDIGYALMTAGSKIASTPGGLLQSLGAGLGEAAPVLMQSAKERKAEERLIRKGLRDLEEGNNTYEARLAQAQMEASKTAISGAEGEAVRKARAEESAADRASREKIAFAGDAATLQAALITAKNKGAEEGTLTPGQYIAAQQKRLELLDALDKARTAWQQTRPKKGKLLRDFQSAEKQLKLYDAALARAGASATAGGQGNVVDVPWNP